MSTVLDALERSERDAQACESRALSVVKAKRGASNPIGNVDVGQLAAGGQSAMFGGGAQAGKAIRAYQFYKSWIYAIINVIGNRLGAQPFMVGKNPRAKAKGKKPGKAGAVPPASKRVKVPALPYVRQKAAGDAEIEIVPDHELMDVLDSPNRVQTKAEWVKMIVANLYLTGECYIVGGEWEGRTEMWAVPTSWIEAKHEDGLFTSYVLKPPNTAGEGTPLEAAQVARLHNPDPADPKKCVSLLETQLSSVKVDQSIQDSQQQMFGRGIFPNIVITVGQNVDAMGKSTGKRPVLLGPQRAQFIRAIRQVWRDTTGQGDPAIIDGLIERIDKLSHGPQEMDWQNSAEQIKARIFQAFGVHPFIVGAEAPGSYAQMYVVERLFADNVINPLADQISCALSRWLGEAEGLLIWLEPAEPRDAAEENRLWIQAFGKGAVDTNEFRVHRLGLPAVEETEGSEAQNKPVLATTVGGIQGVITIATAVSQGIMSEDAGVAQLMYFFEIGEEQAREMLADAGKGTLQIQAQPPQLGPDGKPVDDKPPDEGEPPEDGVPPDKPIDEEEAAKHVAREARRLKGFLEAMARAGETKIKRSAVKAAHVRQQARLEKEVRDHASRYFRGQLKAAARELRKLKRIDYEDPSGEAARLAKRIFDARDWEHELQVAVGPALAGAFIQGAVREVNLAKAVATLKARRTEMSSVKVSTATLALEDYDIEMDEDVVTEMPSWLLEAAKEFLDEAFSKPYWQEVNEVTRDDIEWLLEAAIEEGYSIRTMAKYLEQEHGYARSRAINVARTETTGALNGGHEAGIRALGEEAELDEEEFGKEWMSVLSETTRDTHAEADGQIVNINETFTVGGESARFPGDPNLSAGERCNCQCTVLSAFVGDDLEADEVARRILAEEGEEDYRDQEDEE